ncbi:MAG: SH3 domain-containing protein [Chloroflexota bacterium]
MLNNRLRLIALITVLALTAVALPARAQDDGRLENGCLPPVGLPIGSISTLVGGVYVRALPNINSGIVSYAPDRIGVRVLEGPVCANGFNWWLIERQFEEPTFLGWAADGVPGKVFLIPPEGVAPPDCPPALNLVAGQAVATFDGVKVREVPSLGGRVITTALPETSAIVIGPTACIEGFNWWLVNIPVAGVLYEGWIVQDVFLNVDDDPELEVSPIIDPAPDAAGDPASLACGPPAPLQVGAIGRLRFGNEPLKNLRAAPDTGAAVLVQLPNGIQLEILSEAFCNEGVNWRQVRVFGGSAQPVGWIAEGDNLGRFLGPNNEDYARPAP